MTYNKRSAQFECPDDGIYNFAFNCYSDANKYYLFVDEVRVFVPVIPDGIPTTFMAFAVNVNSMTIRWTDNSTNETSFRVYRSTDNVSFSQVGSDIVSTTTAGTGTAYSQDQSGLLPDQMYYYRIVSVADAESGYLTGSQATKACTFSGLKKIGPNPDDDFPSLTDAFDSIKFLGLAGPVQLVLQNGYVSTSAEPSFPVNIPFFSGSSSTNTVTIYPDVSGLALTSASAAATVDLNGAKYVIFDGRVGGSGSTKDLIIENTDVSVSALLFINDECNNTIQN
jgi:hypothetical protein